MSDKEKRLALPNRERPISITLSDGAVFRCWTDKGANDSPTVWVFEDAKGNARMGPIVDELGVTVSELRAMVERWRTDNP